MRRSTALRRTMTSWSLAYTSSTVLRMIASTASSVTMERTVLSGATSRTRTRYSWGSWAPYSAPPASMIAWRTAA